MNPLSYFVVAYAYIAILVFLAGSLVIILRWIFGRKGPTDTYLGYPKLETYPNQDSAFKAFKNMLSRILLFSSAKEDPLIRYTGLAFHWSLWIIILAHADLVITPYLVAAGIPEGFLSATGAYLGTALAFVMVGAGIILILRRITNPYLRRISNASDYFSVILIMAIGVSGILMRFMLPADFAYNSVSPFVLSLMSFSPVNVPYAPIYIIHFIVTLSLFLYLPLSKLVHPYSFFTSPPLYTVSRGGGNQ